MGNCGPGCCQKMKNPFLVVWGSDPKQIQKNQRRRGKNRLPCYQWNSLSFYQWNQWKLLFSRILLPWNSPTTVSWHPLQHKGKAPSCMKGIHCGVWAERDLCGPWIRAFPNVLLSELTGYDGNRTYGFDLNKSSISLNFVQQLFLFCVHNNWLRVIELFICTIQPLWIHLNVGIAGNHRVHVLHLSIWMSSWRWSALLKWRGKIKPC